MMMMMMMNHCIKSRPDKSMHTHMGNAGNLGHANVKHPSLAKTRGEKTFSQNDLAESVCA
jgi:hypothetical protein